MKVFLDTNIVIDFLLNRGGEINSVITILQLGNAKYLDLYVSDLSIANIAYITRKDISKEVFFCTMKSLLKFFSVTSMGEVVIKDAIDAVWNDFEDSLQYLSARQANVDCIITRNIKDFERSEIPVFTPSGFLNTRGN